MSLQLWVPFNGNINNQGLSNVSLSSSGATPSDIGRVSKSYYFDGTDDRVYTQYDFKGHVFTIALWFRPSRISAESQYLVSYNNSNEGSAGQQFAIYINSSGFAIHAGGSVTPVNHTIEVNKWYHVILTSDGTTQSLYVNGIHKAQTGSVGTVTGKYLCIGARSDHTSGPSERCAYYYQGYINDLRIYDHWFNIKEAKELSRGLSLHYKFDNFGRNDNVELDSSGYRYDGVRKYLTYALGSPSYASCTKFSSGSYVEQAPMPFYYNSNEFTVSFWVRLADDVSTSCIFACRTAGGGGVAVFHEDGCLRLDAGGISTFDYGLDNTSWHYIVFVKTNTDKSLYIDGEFKQTISGSFSCGNIAHKGTFGISSLSDTGTPHIANQLLGSLSDFRIYSSVLTSEDITESYITKASIDRKGGLYCKQFNELDDGVQFSQTNYTISVIQSNHQTITVNSAGLEHTSSFTGALGDTWTASVVTETGYNPGTLSAASGTLTSNTIVTCTDATPKSYSFTITQSPNQTITVITNKGTYTSSFTAYYGDVWSATVSPDDHYNEGIVSKAGGTITGDESISASDAVIVSHTLTIFQSDNQLITVNAGGVNHTSSFTAPHGTSWTATLTSTDDKYNVGYLTRSTGILNYDTYVSVSPASKIKQQ